MPPVELPEGIGDDRHVAYRGLLAVPVGEARNLGEETGIGDTALGGRFEGVFEQGIAAQALVHEVRVLPELDALVEEVNQDIVELVARDGQGHRQHHGQPSPEQRPSVAQHDFRHESSLWVHGGAGGPSGARIGRRESRAGRNVTERMKEAAIPKATKLPR